jgi:hypothetical protein
MNKIQLATQIKLETKEKLKKLKSQSGLNIGQLIDLMTNKQKYIK